MKLVLRLADMAHKFALLARRLPEYADEGLFQVAVEMRGDFEKTAATWKDQVRFVIVKDRRGYRVFTKDDIYRFVDEGTRPHIIKAKRAKVLAFQGGYAAKTRPGVIGSTGGGPSGAMQYAKEVHHPGTKARRFTKIIYAKWQALTAKRVQATLKRGIEAVGL